MTFAIRPHKTVLFTGDSITDCGRRGPSAPLGDGYVSLIDELINARYPAHRLNMINTGIGGNTVRDLAERWTDDVVRHQPDWLSIKIGINDIHCWLGEVPDRAVDPEAYAELYELILARTRRETSARLVLVDPFYISTDRTGDRFRASVLEHLPCYLRTIKALAARYKARHVRTHEAFARLLRHDGPDRFCPEPVHPFRSGHIVIAHAWLQALGW